MSPEIRCLHDEVLPIADFNEHPQNPNRHPDKQIALLGRVILENGWRNPLVVSKRSGLLIRGHGRLQAAKVAGMQSCPVSYQDYEDEAAEIADMVADNVMAELSTRDNLAILALVKEIQDAGGEAFSAGFTDSEIQSIELALDEDPPGSRGRFTEEGASITHSMGMNNLTLAHRTIPLGDDELAGLTAKAEEYVREHGSIEGFAKSLTP